MKKYGYFCFLFVFFLGCSAQKKYDTVSNNNYKLITTFSFENKNETHFLNNETDLKNFYNNLNQTFKKSLPRKVVNFDERKIALVYKNHINSFNIDSISGNDKIYQINLSQIKNINLENDHSNFLMIEIPKSIEKITLKLN